MSLLVIPALLLDVVADHGLVAVSADRARKRAIRLELRLIHVPYAASGGECDPKGFKSSSRFCDVSSNRRNALICPSNSAFRTRNSTVSKAGAPCPSAGLMGCSGAT